MVHRIGFIGAGDVVRKAYLPAVTRRADCRVVAICSESGRTARELAAREGIPTVCNEYGELLEHPEIDTVFVCTPTHLHREMAETAMSRQKNVLVEKPLCATYADARALLQKAAGYPKTFYPAFNNQFREENQWLRAEVLSGELGMVRLMDFEWYRTKRYEDKAWLYDAKRSGGGVLMDLGSHLIHLALSLIPNRRRFTAYCHSLCHSPASSSVEDTSAAMVVVDEQILIHLRVGWDMKMETKSCVVLEVHGTAGRLSNLDYAGSKRDGYEAMVDDFLGHIEEGRTRDLALVADAMLLLDVLYRSSSARTAISGTFGGMA